MSSIMRARNALTGRGEEAEVIGGVLFELKVAGPSMLGIGCPDRHPLPLIHSPPPPKMHSPRRRPPARAGSFDALKLPLQGDERGLLRQDVLRCYVSAKLMHEVSAGITCHS